MTERFDDAFRRGLRKRKGSKQSVIYVYSGPDQNDERDSYTPTRANPKVSLRRTVDIFTFDQNETFIPRSVECANVMSTDTRRVVPRAARRRRIARRCKITVQLRAGRTRIYLQFAVGRIRFPRTIGVLRSNGFKSHRMLHTGPAHAILHT